MPLLRVHNLAMWLDGYVAGPDQGLDNPLGVGGERLHDWAFATRSFHDSINPAGGESGIDDDFVRRGTEGVGATLMGRNMFGPVRGPWPDESWTGWWGANPPFHHPVFVLTHHPRASVAMEGGTTFHFVDDPDVALMRAFDAAGGQDVRLGGGARTVQHYLRAGRVDELHVAVVPVLLGAGERLFDRLEGGPTGYTCAELVASRTVTHVRLVRAGAGPGHRPETAPP